MPEKISLEVLLSDEVRRLLDSCAAAMKIQVVFYSRDGRILRRGRSFGNSRYCDCMQRRFFGGGRCIELDRAMQRRCLETGSVCRYRCHAGLEEIIAPVRVFGEVAGFIMFGQFRTTDTPPEFTSGHAEVRQFFRELPFFAPEEAGSLEVMAKVLLDYIAARELVTAPGGYRYQKLLYLIESRFAGPLTLKQAARYLNISESGLTHFLRDEYRTSFKELLIAKRLDAADALLRNDPALTVAEAARQCGFNDPHYFSRLYRRKRGVPPGVARRGGE